MNVVRADAMTMLVTDPLLPNSLARSFGQAASYLASVGPGAGVRAGARAQRVAGRLHAMVLYEWPDTDDHDDFLRRMDAYCRELHELGDGGLVRLRGGGCARFLTPCPPPRPSRSSTLPVTPTPSPPGTA